MTDIITYGDLLKKDIPAIEYLVDGIIPKSSLVFCFGAPGSFKTNFLLYTSMMGCEGKDVLGFKVKAPFTTLWIDEENRDTGMKDKISKISKGIEWTDINNMNNNIAVISSGFQIISPNSMVWLDETINKYKPDMIVIDSIAKVFPLNERDEKDVRQIYSQLGMLIKKYRVSFVLIHHSRKMNFQQKNRDMEDIAGSREFSAMSDSMILIQERGNSEFILEHVKNRYGKKSSAINFGVIGDDDKISVIYSGIVHDKYIKKETHGAEVLMTWLTTNHIKKFRTKEATEFLEEEGFPLSTSKKILTKLLRDTKISHKEHGYYEVLA